MPLLVQVDAFADRPFAGNPAAVCVLDTPPDAAWMQCVAEEMNLAATAFVWRQPDSFGLRWFSPMRELALCGHGTLAAAHVLFEHVDLPTRTPLVFQTAAGRLTASRRGSLIELDFPAEPSAPAEAPPDLLRALALGQEAVHVERNQYDYVVELSSEAAVRAVQPDVSLLRTLPVRGLIVTARAGPSQADFVSRFFAPAVGIDEDAVTGSAHCCLAPYWSARLDKSSMVGVQVSRRGGTVHVRMAGNRVHLAGQAVTVLRGQLV